MSIDSQNSKLGPGSEKLLLNLFSLGCPKNLLDGEEMMASLEKSIFSLVDLPEEADVVVINTCAFIESAQREAVDEILRLAELKKSGQVRFLIVAGCLAERHGSDLMAEIPEIDAIIGPGEISAIAAVVFDVTNGKKGICRTGTFEPPAEMPARVRTGSPSTAYLKISEGCSHHCAFCMIPQLRGPQRSKPLEAIVEEVASLVETGTQEIILVAQDTTAWGRDLPGKPALSDLLTRLEVAGDGPRWIRLLYGHINYWTDELTASFSRGKRLLPYIDLPIQHIADQVLQRMGRRVRGCEIRDLLTSLRRNIPNVVIRTTILVGHPGETEAEFSELVSFLGEFPFDRLGAFAYSPEAGTPAATFADRPDSEVARSRLEQVLELQKNRTGVLRRQKIGNKLDLLVEGIHTTRRYAVGRSYGEAPEIDGSVYVKGLVSPESVNPGDFLPVKIIGAGPYDYVTVPLKDLEV